MKLFGREFKVSQIFKKDKRKKPRFRVFEDVYVDYKTQRPDRSIKGTGEGRDISVLGIQFFADHKLPAGTPLELTLQFTPGVLPVQQICLHARVLRSQKGFREKQCRIACEFENVDLDTTKHLEAFVSWFKQREGKYLFFRYNTPE